MTAPKPSSDPSVALALGGGGARGISHLVVLEAFDELGIRPTAIAGTSIGAIVGAAYAAGIPAKALRKHMLDRFRDPARVLSQLLEARVGKITDLFVKGFANPVLVDGEKVLDLFWPEEVPDLFEDLAIPFIAIATDFYGRSETAIDSGPLVSAVAASMAVPGLVRPVTIGGRHLIDGGVVNPLPFDRLANRAQYIVAVDVAGGPAGDTSQRPEPFEAMIGATQIMQAAIVNEKLAVRTPDLLIRPEVEHYRVLDFLKAKAILAAAEPCRDAVKRGLAALFEPPKPARVSAARRKTP